VTAAHGGVEYFQVEKGFVERLAVLLVGLVFGADILASQRLDLITLYL